MELNWTKEKPTETGAYWVRGWNLNDGCEQEMALVTAAEVNGELCSDLHETNSCSKDWKTWAPILHGHHDSFEWCGPLVPPTTNEGMKARLAEGSRRLREMEAAGSFCFSDNGDDIDRRMENEVPHNTR